MMKNLNVPPDNHVKVLGGQGWVGLIDHLGSERNSCRIHGGRFGTEVVDQTNPTLTAKDFYMIVGRNVLVLHHNNISFRSNSFQAKRRQTFSAPSRKSSR